MGSGTRFEPEPGFHDKLVADSPAKQMATEVAQRIADEATAAGARWSKSYAAKPVSVLEGAKQDAQGRWRGEGGKFVKTFGMRVEANANASPNVAAFGGVGSWIEFGTTKFPPRSPLRNAVIQCGYELGE